MNIFYTTDPVSVQRMNTDELRKTFLIDDLFTKDEIVLNYSDNDRSIIGSAVPYKLKLKLLSSKKEMAAEYFLERREIGIINIGGKGKIIVENNEYVLDKKDMIYIGKGNKEIHFESLDSGDPACYYFVSYPAHTEFPTKIIKKSDAEKAELGSVKDANKRTINRYIHLNGVKSCQLVMGMTELEEGSVWNTMPVHTHQRRTEVYMYFDLSDDSIVMHFLGQPDQTRHIIIRNKQAVLSPIWSIHSGCGTTNYSFVWSMGGENQVFSDMDAIAMSDLK